MSKIYVDEIAGIASADTVAIPGHVIQVVQFTTTTNESTTSTSAVATSIEATITPSSTSSKILVQTNLNGIQANTTSKYVKFWLYKNDSLLQSLQEGVARQQDLRHECCSNSYLDSPATTSAVKYTVYWASSDGNSVGLTNYVANANTTLSGITLMEIAG